jgi:hypothetical protein
LEVEYEDIVMKMFMQTLEGDARAWYKSLPIASINGWDSFKKKFTEKWGHKQDSTFMLAKFTSIHKNENETVSNSIIGSPSFIQGFLNLYAPVMRLLWYIISMLLTSLLIFCSGKRTYKTWRASAAKLEKNMIAAKKVRPSSSRLFDPRKNITSRTKERGRQ